MRKKTAVILKQSKDQKDEWLPIYGSETTSFLENLRAVSTSEKVLLRNEAMQILSKCINPKSKKSRRETGLATGYVQSGKTASFTTLGALARDNSYQLIIVIAGTSVNLFNQSVNRLQKDLRLDEGRDRAWYFVTNPTPEHYERVNDRLAAWKDKEETVRETVLIAVMKHHKHLQNIIELIQNLDDSSIPTLIIDDEADQASLNSRVNQGDKYSTTYERLLELRDSLNRHSYVQYTATPQAPLLINLIDTLSPKFAEVLTPGAAYVGGKDFFKLDSSYLQTIPDEEIPPEDEDDPPGDIPSSLIRAMEIFFIGVSAGMLVPGGPRTDEHRSMMIHPSQRKNSHKVYWNWTNNRKKLWQKAFEKKMTRDLNQMKKSFFSAYKDIRKTETGLPAFNKIWKKIPTALRNTQVEEVNTRKGKTPEIKWKQSYSHILVGGTAMDRGYTVEGLTVTYMPRSLGVGNADTIQQRARFFGYKRKYLGLCRVFLSESESIQRYKVQSGFRNYVAHEEDIRKRLKEHSKTGKNLSEWKRIFFLDPALKPTRDSVLNLEAARGDFINEWARNKVPIDAAKFNKDLIEKFLKKFSKQVKRDHQYPRHKIINSVKVRDLFENLLIPYRHTHPTDTTDFIGLVLQIEKFLESNGKATCRIYLMGTESGENRNRTADEDGFIKLMQGADPSRKKYPGDDKIRDNDRLTVQIHTMDIKFEGKVIKNVPGIAVWVPEAYSYSWYQQTDKLKDRSGVSSYRKKKSKK